MSSAQVSSFDSFEDAANKVPYLVKERIKQVDTVLAANWARLLSPRAKTRLSDNLVKVKPDGQILLEFHSARAVGNAEAASLQSFGADIVFSTTDIQWPAGATAPRGYGMIQAWIAHNMVLKAPSLDWVVAGRPIEDNPPNVGPNLSKGVALHNADIAQDGGIYGTGINIGAISNGVQNLAASQAQGELPAITNLFMGSGDEGTAMLESIHDMAPGAALFFHGDGGGAAGHVTAMNNLVNADVDIIGEDM